MRLPYISPTDTPILDALEGVTGGEALATYHGQPGGEWDTLRAVPLRVRRSLTGAGFLSLHGEHPDVFCDMLRRYGGSSVEPDPISWYVRQARQAMLERRAAHTRDVKRAIAKRAGVGNYYEYRRARAQAAGFDSFWAYRNHRGWNQ